ncbi:MAG: DUF4399 domain-containing protein [Geminicoccales bacterium]
MRRCRLGILIVFVAITMTGCSYFPTFPDIWPYNDPPEEEAVETPSPEPTAKIAQAPIAPQAQPAPGSGGPTPSVPGAVAYIVSPSDGDTVTNPVRVIFGLDRMGIAPVTSTHESTGHHHLLIDTELPQLDLPIPVDDNHRHFSGGQTEASLNLPIGEHTLQLLLGDHTHTPHQPPVFSRQISIIVQ